jgi:hypothetical protein
VPDIRCPATAPNVTPGVFVLAALFVVWPFFSASPAHGDHGPLDRRTRLLSLHECHPVTCRLRWQAHQAAADRYGEARDRARGARHPRRGRPSMPGVPRRSLAKTPASSCCPTATCRHHRRRVARLPALPLREVSASGRSASTAGEAKCTAAGCHNPHTPSWIYVAALPPFQGTGIEVNAVGLGARALQADGRHRCRPALLDAVVARDRGRAGRAASMRCATDS